MKFGEFGLIFGFLLGLWLAINQVPAGHLVFVWITLTFVIVDTVLTNFII